jgi:hypothetical protein
MAGFQVILHGRFWMFPEGQWSESLNSLTSRILFINPTNRKTTFMSPDDANNRVVQKRGPLRASHPLLRLRLNSHRSIRIGGVFVSGTIVACPQL